MQVKSIDRVYTLDVKKDKGNNELIVGTRHLNNHHWFVLFDHGNTLFYSNTMYEASWTRMMVTTAMDNIAETHWMCENCTLSVNGQIFQIYLIWLPLKNIDTILGMDWLSVNSVYIGCREKVIFIPTDEAISNDVVTTLLEGMVSMVSCLFEQEMFVLLILTKELSEEMNVTQIPVVCEFLEVFPKDVTYLPPKRKVEFFIDLVPGTTPIYVAPYHMSPLKIRELKNRLEELLSKHFIRINVSPWGALVLLVNKKDSGMHLCIEYW